MTNDQKPKIKVLCRKGHTIYLPCNWVKQGLCGEDIKPCKIVMVVKEE